MSVFLIHSLRECTWRCYREMGTAARGRVIVPLAAVVSPLHVAKRAIVCVVADYFFFITSSTFAAMSSPRRLRAMIVPSGPKRMMCGMPWMP